MSTAVAPEPAIETPVVEPPVVEAPVIEAPVVPAIETPVVAEPPVVPGVPETYDLKLPDGSTVDPALVERTAATARELGLSNDKAQALLDATARDVTARETAAAEANKVGGTAWVARESSWATASLADPDLGAGDKAKLDVVVAQSQQALAKFGSPDVTQFLKETGLGSHPAFLKVFANIGKAMAEPTSFVMGGPPVTAPRSQAEAMYGPTGMDYVQKKDTA